MASYSHARIHSSWNSDRMGSCIANKPHKVRQPRKAYYYAQYCGNEVSICGSRGKKRFTFTFDSDVVSAVIRDGVLVVTTADQWVRTYEVVSGRLVSECCPTPPAGQIGGFCQKAAA